MYATQCIYIYICIQHNIYIYCMYIYIYICIQHNIDRYIYTHMYTTQYIYIYIHVYVYNMIPMYVNVYIYIHYIISICYVFLLYLNLLKILFCCFSSGQSILCGIGILFLERGGTSQSSNLIPEVHILTGAPYHVVAECWLHITLSPHYFPIVVVECV